MTWGPLVQWPGLKSPEELEEMEEQRAHGRTLRRLGYVLACALAVLALDKCAAVGDSVATVAACPRLNELPAAQGG